MAEEICDVPIISSTKCVELTTTPQTLAELGITFKPENNLTRIIFEGRWALREIARYSRDPSASISDTVGALIFPGSKICLNELERESLFRTVSGTLTICVEQYKALEVCDFQDQYRNALAQLLPDGFAWEAKCIPGSVLYRLLNAIGKLMSDLHCSELELQKEFYASTCVQLCENWADERIDNDIGECLQGIELSNAQEISAIVAKIIATGSTTAEGYIAIGAALGLEVEVNESPGGILTFDIIGADISPMLACDLACARMFDGPDMNFILAFKCIMEKIRTLGLNHEFTFDGVC